MTFLVILCEGETEMDFVRDMLRDHLLLHGVQVQPILLGKKVQKDLASAPGGVLKYEPVYRHIEATMRQYSATSSRVTTMLDMYAFPRDFPDYDKYSAISSPYERVQALEGAMKRQVKTDRERFIPNIQLHEFEALILSKPEEILPSIPGDDAAIRLAALRADIGDLKPEEINQTKEGAPSKRLERFIPAYRKRTMGPAITRRIGVHHLKATCPHFANWLSTLEGLGHAQGNQADRG